MIFVVGPNCVPKSFPDGDVCVCDGIKCDILGSVKVLSKKYFVKYETNGKDLRMTEDVNFRHAINSDNIGKNLK